MNNSLVSVVMCTYNGSRFVGEQIQSVIDQDYSSLELIIVDDASADNTYSILQSYAEKDGRIKLFRNEQNMGFNLNFDKACRLATGDFIAIADQDDVWHLSKLKKLMQKIGEDEQILMVHCISARFEKFGEFHLKSPKLVNYHAGKDVKNFFLSNFISGHNMLLRKSLLNYSMPFPPHVYYDWWLAAVASSYGKIESLPEILVWHRMHDSNATGAAKPRIMLHEQIKLILPRLMEIKEMKREDKEFAAQLLQYYQEFPKRSFSPGLFRFLFRNASVLFAQKKRKFPCLSYLKHSFKSARRDALA